jgi:hypothetical protein
VPLTATDFIPEARQQKSPGHRHQWLQPGVSLALIRTRMFFPCHHSKEEGGEGKRKSTYLGVRRNERSASWSRPWSCRACRAPSAVEMDFCFLLTMTGDGRRWRVSCSVGGRWWPEDDLCPRCQRRFFKRRVGRTKVDEEVLADCRQCPPPLPPEYRSLVSLLCWMMWSRSSRWRGVPCCRADGRQTAAPARRRVGTRCGRPVLVLRTMLMS